MTSEEPRSSKNYEVLNSDGNISAGFQPTRLLQLIIFFKVFSNVAVKRVWPVKSSVIP